MAATYTMQEMKDLHLKVLITDLLSKLLIAKTI